MANDDAEEQALSAGAPTTLESLRLAWQRAEQQLAETRAALERRTAELEQRREWFEVTLASIGDAVITTDVQGRVTFLNPVAEVMTGWSNADAAGQPLETVFRIINEDTRQPADNPVERVLKTGTVVGLANHTALIARDGREIAVEDSAAPIRDATGTIAGAVMVFHDVTQRRQAVRAIFSQAAVGIADADLDGRFGEANHKFCEIVGYAPHELRERTFLAITHPDDVALTRREMHRLLDGVIPSYTVQKRYIRRDGTEVWSNTSVTLLRRESGEPERFIGVTEDITDRKQAEALRSRLAAVVEFSDDAIITKTLDGIITTWNPGAERMFGYTASEVIGRSVTLLIPPDHIDEEPAILDRLKRGERIDHYETVRVTRNGAPINVSLSVSPLRDGAGHIIGASKIARDITRQKRAEVELRALYGAAQREIVSRERAEAALRETDRRKDEFLATLAHELRNPLAPIRQAALISKSATATDAQKRWSHDVITRQVQHMSLLLDDLLDISRVTRGMLELRTEMTELPAIIDAAIETARPAIDAKRHRFTTELPSEPVLFAADPLRLAQVLSNLLTNAAKYTDAEGRIHLRASADSAHVTIKVSDTGIGIPADALGRVFTMFSQVKSTQDRAEGGLGIGLSLAKGLVELHGGTIEARSAGVGRGSEFIVRLPRRTISHSPTQSVSAASASKGASRRVLIADDNRDAAESLGMLLQMDGHDVTVVHDGREALATFKTLLPEVALLDIGMPGLDGYEVARQVRRESLGRAVTLIAVTGWGQESDKARALAAGFNHHFTKPIDPQRISELLRGGLA